jgi:hypothetical protein
MQSSCCYLVFLVLTAHWDPERVIWQGRLQRLCLVPGCTQPNVALLLGGQENWHRLWMDRRDDRVGRRGQDAVDLVRTRNRLGLRAAVSFELNPDAGEAEQRPAVVEREPNNVLLLVSGFGLGPYSAKLFAGTRQRFSGFNQPRQCGDDVLRILVTGGPPDARIEAP